MLAKYGAQPASPQSLEPRMRSGNIDPALHKPFRHGKTCGPGWDYYGAFCEQSHGRSGRYHIQCVKTLLPDEIETLTPTQRHFPPRRHKYYVCPDDGLCHRYGIVASRIAWRPGSGPAPRIVCLPRPPHMRKMHFFPSDKRKRPDSELEEDEYQRALRDHPERTWQFGFVPIPDTGEPSHRYGLDAQASDSAIDDAAIDDAEPVSEPAQTELSPGQDDEATESDKDRHAVEDLAGASSSQFSGDVSRSHKPGGVK